MECHSGSVSNVFLFQTDFAELSDAFCSLCLSESAILHFVYSVTEKRVNYRFRTELMQAYNMCSRSNTTIQLQIIHVLLHEAEWLKVSKNEESDTR